MKILSPYCIQLPTIREDSMSRLKRKISTELAIVSEIVTTVQNDGGTADHNQRSPISEIKLSENSILGIFSSLGVGSYLEVVRSRLNAVLIC